MDIINEYVLELLNESTVNVVLTKYVEIDGVKTKLGDTTSCCYNNCPYDIERLENTLPENYFNAVMAVWGYSSEENSEE